MTAQTLFDKLWDSHLVQAQPDGNSLLYIDRHFVIDVTSAQAYEGMRLAGRRVRRPDSIIAAPDHNTPTRNWDKGITDPVSKLQMETLEGNVVSFGALHYYPFKHRLHGIAHVIGPEQGATLPGMTIACGDSHTTTHGALGALAFGIGTSEVELVLATQCLAMKRLKNMRVNVEGTLMPGVSAKDVALALIAKVGTGGGVGHAIEYTGSTVRGMSMEARMTLCNMAIEAGARAGLVAVDDTTIDYVRGRLHAPTGAMWDSALPWWRQLHSDADAVFDKVVELDAASIEPQVSWGTSPELVAPITGRLPDPRAKPDASRREWLEGALRYMGLQANMRVQDISIDKVFIGSCANSRIEDLRAAARIVEGRKVAPNITQALVVPGSGQVKAQGEREGLDKIFRDAGFEWREAGCSMCVGINEDRLSAGERCASTSNRNFEGRQGPGGRTHLLSPEMAAAAAIAGHFVDVRDWQRTHATTVLN
jgi:3-isopropylmalate/(R)-2-methylmalate dehydratase large subunit